MSYLKAAWRGLWHAGAASVPILGVITGALVLVDVVGR